MTEARTYLAKAKQCEQRARKARCPNSREWQLILARAYRMLAEAEGELVRRPLAVAASGNGARSPPASPPPQGSPGVLIRP